MEQENNEKRQASVESVIATAKQELSYIADAEPAVGMAIGMIIEHVYHTYSDKYAKGQEKGIDTKAMLYDEKNGKAINQYQIARYLQRYVTQGTKKSGLLIDLLKMTHYAIFEIVRRILANQLDNNEPAI